jgi:hypothetical protein
MTGTGVALLFCTSGPASGSLLDVRDPRGFVAACIQKSGVRPSAEQREDLIAEGLMILCELAGKFEPQRQGYAQAGRFSGYAAAYLPRRMQDVWQQMNPTISRRDEDGRREVEFLTHSPLDDQELRPLVATYGLVDIHERYETIERALSLVPAEYAFGGLHRKVVACIDEGMSTDETARALRLDRDDVSAIQTAVADAISQVRPRENA